MKWSTQERGKDRMKRPKRVSTRKTWAKLTPELYGRISEWEQQQGTVKHTDIESYWNVNRSTYYRWKKLHQEKI